MRWDGMAPTICRGLGTHGTLCPGALVGLGTHGVVIIVWEEGVWEVFSLRVEEGDVDFLPVAQSCYVSTVGGSGGDV